MGKGEAWCLPLLWHRLVGFGEPAQGAKWSAPASPCLTPEADGRGSKRGKTTTHQETHSHTTPLIDADLARISDEVMIEGACSRMRDFRQASMNLRFRLGGPLRKCETTTFGAARPLEFGNDTPELAGHRGNVRTCDRDDPEDATVRKSAASPAARFEISKHRLARLLTGLMRA